MNKPPFDNLADWLAWQETLHPEEIELGLDRIREVADRLGLLDPKSFVITVGGTNGKGSSVAMLSAALRSNGYLVGAYTSPHLLRYNERIEIDGLPCMDEELCEAFTAVNEAREGISLTYFEFGTLAALWVLRNRAVEVMVLEVGMGGRLDAVNIINPDIALVTNIGLDHIDWLGNDRGSIALEKAGILRTGQRAVYNDPEPVSEFISAANAIGSELSIVKRDYNYQINGQTWCWNSGDLELAGIPVFDAPAHQVMNAAAVLQCLLLASESLSLNIPDSANGLLRKLPHGRGQSFSVDIPGSTIEVLVDVAHNQESVKGLQALLKSQHRSGKTHAIFSAMRDKPIELMASIMNDVIDEWYVAGLPVARASTETELHERLGKIGINSSPFPSVLVAWQTVLSKVTADDRVVVFGSFYTVEAIFRILFGSSRDV